MCKEELRNLVLERLKMVHEEYNKYHDENLTLFEILEYGHLEIPHTKFLYWMLRPAYHKSSYGDGYVRAFLRENNVDVPDDANIVVNHEQTSDEVIGDDESKRRVDLYIDIGHGKNKRRVIIENKVFSTLDEFQVDHECKQYLRRKHDMFIGFLLDQHTDEFQSLMQKSEVIENYKRQGYIFNLFTYSDWLELNNKCIGVKGFFNESEKKKIRHLNENIRRLIRLSEIKTFNENYKTYLKSYDSIGFFQDEFESESKRFLTHLMNRVLKQTILENGRLKQRSRGILFDYKKYDIIIGIVFDPEWFLTDNIGNIYAEISRDNEYRDELISRIEHREDYDRDTSGNSQKWISFSVNPLFAEDCEKQYMDKILDFLETLQGV